MEWREAANPASFPGPNGLDGVKKIIFGGPKESEGVSLEVFATPSGFNGVKSKVFGGPKRINKGPKNIF